MNGVSRHNSEHYVWGDRCDGWHLLRADLCSVIQERMPPSTSEVAHFHNRSRQFFFVLSGRLSILLEGQLNVLGDQQGLHVPPKSTHRVFNDSDSDANFIVISVPPAHGDRVVAP